MSLRARLLGRTRRAYREAFGSPAGRIVLADLADFCGRDLEAFEPGDPHTTAYRLGLRRAYERIQRLCGMTEAEFQRIVDGERAARSQAMEIPDDESD